TRPGSGKPVEIRAVPGEHRVKVNADGFETVGEVVTVTDRKSAPLSVRLVPLGKSAPAEAKTDDGEDARKLNSQAWELATAADAPRRSAAKAVELATRACRIDGFQSPLLLDTLAAAHAEAGHFGEAVTWQTQAIKQLAPGDDSAEFRARLELYQRGKPYH